MNSLRYGIWNQCVGILLGLTFFLVSGPVFFCECAGKIVAVQELVAGGDCCAVQLPGHDGGTESPCTKQCFESWTLGFFAQSDISCLFKKPEKPGSFMLPSFMLSGAGLDRILPEIQRADFYSGTPPPPNSLPRFLRFRALLI